MLDFGMKIHMIENSSRGAGGGGESELQNKLGSIGIHVLQVDMPVFFYIDPDYVRDPFLQAVFQIQIYLIWIRIQYFRLNTDADPDRGF
jgi:hypothetical protein